jgi:pyruvate kinase
MIHDRTKIVCTIGPASESLNILRKMVLAGMDVARLNFSHGTYKQYEKIISNIRKISKELDVPIAILQDLQGPKIRVNKMPKQGVTLKKGQEIILSTSLHIGSKNIISVQYKNLPREVKTKDKILIKDGMIELRVLKTKKDEILCKVEIPGTVFSNNGINVPTASIKAKVITEKDKKDLAFGLKHNVDYVALSFVKKAKNIRDLRSLIKNDTKIIAKIERHEAIRNLENIIEEADGIMVARGDLGVEIKPEQVPLVQKKIIHHANLHGKPVITATEMLASMIKNPRATRAEISDAANAIFDHTDALMLSNETAVGKFPVKAVQTLSKVAKSTEKELEKHKQFLPNKLYEENVPVSYALCSSAARLARNIDAKAIVAITKTGFTARHISKHRIYVPIIAITESEKVRREMQLVWGVERAFVGKSDYRLEEIIKKHKLAKKGDKIVVVSNASGGEKVIRSLLL